MFDTAFLQQKSSKEMRGSVWAMVAEKMIKESHKYVWNVTQNTLYY